MIPQKYHKPLEFSFYSIAIFLFLPFVIAIILGAFAIGGSEKSTVTRYFYLIGSLFVDRWLDHILVVALIIIGLVIKKHKKLNMIITKPIFFILIGLVLVMCIYFVSDHIINYETWGNNEQYFIKDYHGYEVTCDVNYFVEPTNCKVIDDNGIQVSNDILSRNLAVAECMMIEDDNLLPCRMD